MVVEEGRIWFEAAYGLDGVSEISREQSGAVRVRLLA